MDNKQNSFVLDMQKLIDLLITVFSFSAAWVVRKFFISGSFDQLAEEPNYKIILLIIIIAWFISFKWMGMYMSYREQPFWQFFTTILKSCFFGMILVSITIYFFRIQAISRLLMGIFLIFNITFMTLAKFIILKILEKVRTDELNVKKILIVGSKKRAKQVIEVVEKHNATGYMILGCFGVDKEQLGLPVFNEHKVIGLVEDLEMYLRDNVVDELIFAMSLKRLKQGDRYLAFAESMGIKVRIVPDWELHYLMFSPNIAAVSFEEFLGVQTMALQSTPQNEGMMLIKHVSDFLGALILIIILLPVLASIGIAIKIFSRGPVLYTQERLGMNGRRFLVYKFRTMVKDADERLKELEEMNEADGPAFKIKNDPRIIPFIGTFLRKTSLDELPQLFNVLKTEMSLVGPRPPIPKEVDEYSVWQRRRLSMRPGMTCLWQIAPRRNELSFEDWIKLDLKYIDNWSLLNDLKILVLTAKAVLTGAGR